MECTYCGGEEYTHGKCTGCGAPVPTEVRLTIAYEEEKNKRSQEIGNFVLICLFIGFFIAVGYGIRHLSFWAEHHPATVIALDDCSMNTLPCTIFIFDEDWGRPAVWSLADFQTWTTLKVGDKVVVKRSLIDNPTYGQRERLDQLQGKLPPDVVID